jgi:sucrose-6-phosphate hydrolase SacC (GH32 family)
MDTQPATKIKPKSLFLNTLRVFMLMVVALASTGFSVDTPLGNKIRDWDGAYLMKPSVLHETSGYKIWYDGADFDENIQIGLAKSRDGISWKKAPQNPVLDGDPDAWDASGEHAPFVMKDGNLYKMWYEGSDGNVRQLGYATSHNGIKWTKYPRNPVLQAGPESYDQFVAGHGTVLHEDGLYKLWYHAIGDLDGIGDVDAIIAYATSPDGIQWTKHGPVLVGVPDSWDTGLWGPSVLKVNGTYWMWYSAGGPIYNISIGAATSPNGVDWTRVGDSPVITDLGFINNFGDPHVIFDGGLFKMWMGNFSNDRAIYYAESENGIDWSEPIPSLFPGTSQ